MLGAHERADDNADAVLLDSYDFFNTMNRTQGITFVMVTHNTDLANQTPRRLKMHQGTLQML